MCYYVPENLDPVIIKGLCTVTPITVLLIRPTGTPGIYTVQYFHENRYNVPRNTRELTYRPKERIPANIAVMRHDVYCNVAQAATSHNIRKYATR